MDATVLVKDEVLSEIEDLTSDELKEGATKALSRPERFMSSDSELWDTHTLMFATVAWNISDRDVVGESNYRAILRDYSEKYPDDVEDFSFSHWTYSRYNCIKVRVIDENGSVTKAFAELFNLNKYLNEQYPVYDDAMHSEIGVARFDEYLNQLMDTIERDREFANETSTEITLSDEWKEQFRQFIWDSSETETGGSEDHVSDELSNRAQEHADSGWTMEQRNKVQQECWRHSLEFKYSDYRHLKQDSPLDGLPAGWVTGRLGGYSFMFGVDPEGVMHT